MEKYLAYIIIVVLSVFIFITVIAFTKWRDLSQERELKRLVAWCVIPDHSLGEASGHDLPLWAYISNAQIRLDLPQPYRISGDDEWSYVNEIIAEYQKDLTLSFFKGQLKTINSKYATDGEDYFLLGLCGFLSDHQSKYKFLDHEMHDKRLDYKEYGSWGGTLFDATFSLSEFAVVYHKMYYIAYLYCKGNEILNPDGDRFKDEISIKRILDTKQIQLSRH